MPGAQQRRPGQRHGLGGFPALAEGLPALRGLPAAWNRPGYCLTWSDDGGYDLLGAVDSLFESLGSLSGGNVGSYPLNDTATKAWSLVSR